MSDETPIILDDQTRDELESAGKSEHESAIGQAVSGVAASHKGRAVDEIQSVLRQAVRDATGDASALSDRSIERTAQRIADSASHA